MQELVYEYTIEKYGGGFWNIDIQSYTIIVKRQNKIMLELEVGYLTWGRMGTSIKG